MTRPKDTLCGAWKRRLVASSTIVAVAAGLAGHAQAQDGEPDALQEVVVTGSRIARKDYVAASPIVTVAQETLRAGGSVTVEEGLNRLPQFVGANSATTNFAGNGQANLNLRGLGIQRTLVLLDGRRLQPSNSNNAIDVTTIPTALIENVEVITGGASAVYGSDAVAGVVNFRLKRDFDGLRFDAQYGNAEEGDGATRDISVTLGGGFADGRGHAVFSASYADREGVVGSQRPFFELSALSTTIPGGLLPVQGNSWTQAAINSVFATYGVAPGAVNRATSAIGFNADGTLFASGAGVFNYKGPTTDEFYVPAGAAAVLDRSGRGRYIRLPLTRYSAFATADYELTERIRAFAQFGFTDYHASTQLDPVAAGASTGLTVAANNVFVPAGLATLLASRPSPAAPFSFITRLAETGPRKSTFGHNVYQLLGGFSGALPVQDWTWEAYASYGRDNTRTVTTGFPSKSAIQNLLSAADGGQSLCSGGFNPFGLGHTLSPSCTAYVSRTLQTTTIFEQTDAAANLQGKAFDLPAGELRFAAGVGYRRNSYDFTPDQVSIAGDAITFPQAFPVSGATDVYEVYGELLAPLLRDLPGVQALNLDLGYRISHYDTIGSVSTYKAGADWKVAGGLMLRGGLQRAIRAPSVGELYAAPQTGFVPVGSPTSGGRPALSGDPCDIRGAYRTGPNAAQVRALCIAQGVPAAIVDGYTFGSGNINVTTAGNPDLKEETADSWSLGAVWRSALEAPLLAQFSVSIDYYDIKIDQAIGVLGIPQILQSCFNAGGATNPTYSQANDYCALIRRSPLNGAVANETVQPQFNLAAFETTGLDFQVDWNAALGDLGLPDAWGRLSANLVATRLLTFKNQNFTGTPFLDYTGSIGAALTNPYTIAYPEWKAQAGVTWSVGGIGVTGRVRYIRAMKDASRVANAASAVPGVPAYWYFDLNGRWQVTERLELRAGITNLTDKDPPVVGGLLGNTDPATYDVLGRSYFVALKAQF